MSANNWTAVRKATAQSSNAIARQAVMKFPDFLKQNGIITPDQCERMTAELAKKSLYEKGYDVLFDESVTNGPGGIVAEVKSNCPLYPTRFGSNQIELIKADLDAMTGLEPSKGNVSLDNRCKFLVLLDDGNGRVSASVQKLIAAYNKNLRKQGKTGVDVVMWGQKPLNTQDVFVVIL